MYLLKASRMSEAYPSDRRPTLVACHSSATVWNVLLSCTSQTSFSYFFAVDGSIPSANFFLASSRNALACARVTVGYTPKAMALLFPVEAIFHAAVLEPEGTNLKLQTSAIRLFVGFLSGFSAIDLSSIKLHGGISQSQTQNIPTYAPNYDLTSVESS